MTATGAAFFARASTVVVLAPLNGAASIAAAFASFQLARVLRGGYLVDSGILAREFWSALETPSPGYLGAAFISAGVAGFCLSPLLTTLQWEKLVELGHGRRYAAATGVGFGVAVAYGVGFLLPLMAQWVRYDNGILTVLGVVLTSTLLGGTLFSFLGAPGILIIGAGLGVLNGEVVRLAARFVRR